MPEPFDTSSLSDDPAYWDALAQRVTRAAVGGSFASDWLARGRAPWVVATSLAVAATLVFALLARPRQELGTSSADWATVLAPRDAIGRSIASSDAAPPIGEILRVGAQEAPR